MYGNYIQRLLQTLLSLFLIERIRIFPKHCASGYEARSLLKHEENSKQLGISGSRCEDRKDVNTQVCIKMLTEKSVTLDH